MIGLFFSDERAHNATWSFYNSFVNKLKKDKEVNMNDKSSIEPCIADEVKEVAYAPTEGN